VKIRFTAVDEDQWIGLPVITRKIQLLEPQGTIVMVLTITGPAGADAEVALSCCMVATVVCRSFKDVAKDSIILARSAVDGPDMAGFTDATSGSGGVGRLSNGAAALVVGGGGAEDEEERLESDTRLSRALIPRIAGPRLRSS
jgi:hypothetical protein